MRSSALLALVAIALAPLAWAQPRPPTEQEIERASRRHRQPTEAEVEAARRNYRTPSTKQLKAATPSSSAFDVDALPIPKGSVDVEALARAYEQRRGRGESEALIEHPALLVFVTLAMPEPALRRLVEQAKRAQATLVLRGLVNGSVRQTASKVRELIGEHRVNWLIDPEAFDRFGVQQAPSFVLAKPSANADCASGRCASADVFALIAGDVSIDYALEAIERRASAFGLEAQIFLQRMRSAR